MYSMLALDRQATITPDAFISRYKSTALEATVKTVKTTFISSHEEGNEAEVKFNVVFETNAVGTIQQDNTMILRREDNRWGVLWNPGLILSQMSGGGTARFYPLASARADIYDRKGRSLTAPQKQIIVEVVPVEMKNESAVLSGLARVFNQQPGVINSIGNAVHFLGFGFSNGGYEKLENYKREDLDGKEICRGETQWSWCMDNHENIYEMPAKKPVRVMPAGAKTSRSTISR